MRIPIAMFHHVSDRLDWVDLGPFVVKQSTFIRFLDCIEARGMRTLTLCEARNIKNPIQSCVITFDDCGKHLLDAAVPELLKRNMKAVFFMPSAYVAGRNDWDILEGRPSVELMDADDLKYLESVGMEIGGHSHRHVHLARLSHQELANELSTCQNSLSKILGHEITSFAYPYGSIPTKLQVVEKSGFKNSCGIFCPSVNAQQLRRFIIHDGDTDRSMALKLGRLYHWYRSLTDALKPESAFR